MEPEIRDLEKQAWPRFEQMRRECIEREQSSGKAGIWILGATILFFMWWGHFKHQDAPAERDAIPSQAWSFGEPGE